MKILLFLFLFLFLLLSINSTSTNDQPIRIYDLSSSFDDQNKYPNSSESLTCDFIFYFLSVDELKTGISFVYSSNSPHAVFRVPELSNGSSEINSFEFLGAEFGYFEFSIIVTAGSKSSTIVYKFSCIEIPINNLSYSVFNSNQEFNPYNRFSWILKFDGLLFSLNKLKFNESSITYTKIGRNIFAISSFLVQTNPKNIFIDFQPGKQLRVQLGTIFLTINNNKNITLTLHPNINSIVSEKGVGYGPLFKINSFSIFPYYYIYNPSSPYFQNTISPIYGYPGYYTFIGQIKDLDNGKNLTLKTLNGSSFVDVSTIKYSFIEKKQGKFSTSIITSYTQTFRTFFTISFKSIGVFDYSTNDYYLNGLNVISSSFPFGFLNGTNKGYNYEATFIFSPTALSPLEFKINSEPPKSIITIGNNQGSGHQKILSYEIYHLFEFKYIIKITTDATLNNPPGYIKINGIYYYGLEKCTFNDNNHSNFEIIVDFLLGSLDDGIEISDTSGKKYIYTTSSFHSISPPLKINNPFNFDVDIKKIENIRFLFNNIDVKNKKKANIMYFSYTDSNFIMNNKITFALHLSDRTSYIPGEPIQENKFYYSKWNSTLKMFQIEFFVNGNSMNGIVPWFLTNGNLNENSFQISNSFFPLENQLIIFNTSYDGYGPIIISIQQWNTSDSLIVAFEIEDLINGFSHGEIIIRGEIDNSIYKINLLESDRKSGNNKMGLYEYSLLIRNNSSLKCYSQLYIINQVKLYDTQGNRAIFQEWNKDGSYYSTTNPLINYLSAFNSFSFDCGDYNDTTPPELLSFSVEKSQNQRTITVLFEARDLDSGLKPNQFPTLYGITPIQSIKNIPTIISMNETNVKYKSIINVPIGLGNISTLYFSVYGFINNGGHFSGFSSDYISKHFSTVGIDINFMRVLEIDSSSDITSDGGEIWVIGREFHSNLLLKVNYLDGNLGFFQSLSPIITYSTALLFEGIRKTNHSFIIKLVDFNGIESNQILVEPIIFNYDNDDNNNNDNNSDNSTSSEPTLPPSNQTTPTPTPTTTPTTTLIPTLTPTLTPTPTPTSTPLPTNPPQQCKGIPQCGSPINGYCSTTGCVCYSPYIGLDCLSKTIAVDQPNFNLTSPTTEIPVTLLQGSSDENTAFFKTLIVVSSLREMDINGKVIKTFKFGKWSYLKLDSQTTQYTTTINVKSMGDNMTTQTQVVTVLQWFQNEAVIEFANQNISMNPSTTKFTISISSYEFESPLNNLQLIMDASISTTQDDDKVCSLREFGETSSGDNSNYIKIKVDDVSLYGRFIRRAIVDSYIKSVDNVLLDSSLNALSNPSELQSFIGITIPYFTEYVIIDPDFSVLVDDNSVSNEENSFCKNIKPTISSAQLAGIIIGCVLFAIIITIIATYFIIKKRKDSKINSTVNNKMETLASEK
ncbi:hypothetical protein RB653_003103 [Dictyostelium firmibasis]|uniref:EGF-like domain-containing protein n=1 Tax=Dictyostelium firmibasis TaxID=79012 RepID=A0AAN7YZ91_9MYCE